MVYLKEGKLMQGSMHQKAGKFQRPDAALRHKLSNRPDAKYKLSPFDKETHHRYHVYLCRACPWAHRVRIALKLMLADQKLEKMVSFSYVEDIKPDETGWKFPGANDPITSKSYLYQVYQLTPDYTGVITTPALYDRKTNQIICNESADIIRSLNECVGGNWYPDKLHRQIDSVNERVYKTLNNGVYVTGNCSSQKQYEEHVKDLFDTLDWLEDILSKQRYLVSNDQITEADWRLFVTLIRFDTVYFTLFKCNKRKIEHYPNLSNYLRELYPMVADTVHFDSYRTHYFNAFSSINTNKIVPRGSAFPEHLNLPHDRDVKFGGKKNSPDSSSAVKGEFVRSESEFRNWIEKDGDFPPEKGRYHIYVADNCPWCHRVRLARSLLGLEKVITMDVVYPVRDAEKGWVFRPEKSTFEGEFTADTVNHKTSIPEIYSMLGRQGKTVPILFDKKKLEIVNNESSEIIRMMNESMRKFGDEKVDLYPKELRVKIDDLNSWIYETVNNGAYRAGFAKEQEAYNLAFEAYFDTLEALNGILRQQKFLCGDSVTEADVRLFPTIFRHDAVYYTRFLLNKKFVRDLKYLNEWKNRMLELRGVKGASNLAHCKMGYFSRSGNGVVPVGPEWEQ